MSQAQPTRPKPRKLPLFCAAGALFFALALAVFHWRVIIASFPQEYRESSMPVVTALLLKGGNPYDLEHQPQYTTNYGIGYHYAVYPLAALLGPSLPVHRVVSGLFIVCACVLLALILSARGVPPIETALLSLAMYAQLLFFVQPLARPDGLGFFLFLASLYAACALKFSLPGLALCGLLALCGFYTKAYFAAGALYVLIYCFLYIGKIRSLVFGAAFAAALWFTADAAKDAWPTYFNNTILAQMAEARWNSRYLLNQLQVYLYFSKYLLALLLAPLALTLWRRHTYKAAPAQAPLEDKKLSRPDFWRFCLLMGCLLIFGKFGAHNGAWMTYWLQLLSPFLLILAGDAAKRSGMAISCALLLFNLASWRFFLLEQDNPAEYQKQWQVVEELMRQGAKLGDVLATPPLEYYAQRGGNLHFSGQSAFFIAADPPERLARFKRFFLPKEKLERRLKEYNAWLDGALERREFSMVLLTRPDSARIDEKIEKNYELKIELPGEMPQALQAVRIRIYAPLPGKPPAASRSPFRKRAEPATISARPKPVLRSAEPILRAPAPPRTPQRQPAS